MGQERQWLCDCGRWISTAYLQHTHVAETKGASLDDMIAARAAGIDATDIVTMTHTLRTRAHPVRDKPL